MRRIRRIVIDKNKVSDDKKIAIIIATTSNKRNYTKFEDCDFLKILLPSFLENYDKEGKYEYNFHLGYDDDDKFYLENSEKIKNYFNNITDNNRFKINLHKIKNLKGNVGQIWSELASLSSEENEYFYQLGDDIKILTKGWEKDFIFCLYKLNNIGMTGPRDMGRPDYLITQSFVHTTHLSLFKRYYPAELKNWFTDDWIQQIYDGKQSQKHKIINIGGPPRYNHNKQDRNILENILIRDKKIVWVARDKNIIFKENNDKNEKNKENNKSQE